MSSHTGSNERIPRRPVPYFEETESGMVSGILEDGFLNVALNDTNQYGPHAMIVVLGIVATLTGLALGLVMINPIFGYVIALGLVIVTVLYITKGYWNHFVN
jgi:hypothetical protein